jgi:hypothetical protein
MIAVPLPESIKAYFRRVAFFFAFATLIGSWFLFKRLPACVRSVRAGGWPTTGGTVETVEVSAIGEQALGEFGYSYLVEGDRYSGYYSRQYADEQHAWDYVGGLRGQPIVVRYKRGDPEVSALRASDQQAPVDLKGRSFLSSFLSALFARLRESVYPRRL